MNHDETKPSPIDVMSIARVDGTDRPLHQKIYNVLSENGVVASMEGSIVFAIHVNRKDVDVATQVLKSDIRLVNEKIFLNEPACRVNCPPMLLEPF